MTNTRNTTWLNGGMFCMPINQGGLGNARFGSEKQMHVK